MNEISPSMIKLADPLALKCDEASRMSRTKGIKIHVMELPGGMGFDLHEGENWRFRSGRRVLTYVNGEYFRGG